ncbi:FAD-dependent oxidoreductase (plasmid) [Agrobacterium salinitolerans]|uniref:FAD-dependent oxidoreductase n=1 Tax=Agrobacterium salinitolerans TaxID=1183413 RepID=UPI001C24FE0D|nr:FAD-dependent oxidoreductase [Agrobacterium salinitolerans]QXC52516.1 FAD-dependent oxidoreductase [Agrobacterium salinitolerans]
MKTWDIIVIGAGPAGMSAAIEARRHSLSVLLLDEHAAAGGQIYKGVARARPRLFAGLGPSYVVGREIVLSFETCGAVHVRGASVWHIDPDGQVTWSQEGTARQAKAKRIIIATGAQERPFPIPGWTLPGVMSAGAAQIALKTGESAAPGAVFAGSGPLLLLVAAQYLRLGVPVRAVIDTTPPANYFRALAHPKSLASGVGLLTTGLGLLWRIRRAGVPIYFGAGDIRASGTDRLEAMEFRHAGRVRRLEVNNLFLHQGVIPNASLAVAAGCRRVWDQDQLCWRVEADDEGRTSERPILLAGDASRIIGAECAPLSGRLSALAAAHDLGRIDEGAFRRDVAALKAELKRKTAARVFVDTLYRPSDAARIPSDPQTVICRCESVRADDARLFARSGGLDINQFKSEQRCGMGPCQGRMCALTLGAIVGSEVGRDAALLAPPRARPPICPVPLGELASLAAKSERA